MGSNQPLASSPPYPRKEDAGSSCFRSRLTARTAPAVRLLHRKHPRYLLPISSSSSLSPRQPNRQTAERSLVKAGTRRAAVRLLPPHRRTVTGSPVLTEARPLLHRSPSRFRLLRSSTH